MIFYELIVSLVISFDGGAVYTLVGSRTGGGVGGAVAFLAALLLRFAISKF